MSITSCRRWILLLPAMVAALLAGCAAAPEPADLVVLGGRIVTMDEDRPEVGGLAARDGRIVALGSEDELAGLVGEETEVLRLASGAIAVPGLIEGHGHFLSLGRTLQELDLRGAATWDDVVAKVAEAAEGAAPGEWIVGRGWHQEKWARPPARVVEGMPTHDELSRVAPDNPVLLTHASGHAAIVNRRALELAGIDATTPDPPGGEIVRGPDGSPTGLLRETAEELVSPLAEAEPDDAAFDRTVKMAGDECLRNGITSFQDAGTSVADLPRLRRLAETDGLGVRLWVMLSDDDEVLARELPGLEVYREGGAFLTVGGIKRWVDGALGSHGAWLLEPYTDMPSTTGLNIVTAEELRATADLALQHHLQLCSHAIGDRANRVTLDVYQDALATSPDGRNLRWRVEHAQHLDPADVPRFAALGVVAAMQPVHCTSDGPWVEARLGHERAASGAYVWRDLLDSGAVIASGTDTPVEPVDPVATFAAAVTRRMADGRAFFPEQRMTREEALRSMTLDAAWAAFEEDVKGSLEVGKLADVTVLDRDILAVAEDEIPQTRVVATIVGGRVAYPVPSD